MDTAVTVTADELVVELRGLDAVWALRRRLAVPVAHVLGATPDDGAHRDPKGLRHPGLAVPGRWAGTFTRDGETSFWNVTGAARTVVIALSEERWTRLHLTVADPRAVVDDVNHAVSRTRAV